MFATPVASRTLKGSSNGTERGFRHSPYRNVRGEAGIAEEEWFREAGLSDPEKVREDRGRKGLSPSPPSEPCWRFSRTRLSSRWFPHRDWLACTRMPRVNNRCAAKRH